MTQRGGATKHNWRYIVLHLVSNRLHISLTSVTAIPYEPRYEKTGFLYMRKQRRSFAVTAKLISAFVFATQIVQSLYFLNPNFQASSHFLWLPSPVCVRPGRKPRRPVFSQRGSYFLYICRIRCDDRRTNTIHQRVNVYPTL